MGQRGSDKKPESVKRDTRSESPHRRTRRRTQTPPHDIRYGEDVRRPRGRELSRSRSPRPAPRAAAGSGRVREEQLAHEPSSSDHENRHEDLSSRGRRHRRQLPPLEQPNHLVRHSSADRTRRWPPSAAERDGARRKDFSFHPRGGPYDSAHRGKRSIDDFDDRRRRNYERQHAPPSTRDSFQQYDHQHNRSAPRSSQQSPSSPLRPGGLSLDEATDVVFGRRPDVPRNRPSRPAPQSTRTAGYRVPGRRRGQSPPKWKHDKFDEEGKGKVNSDSSPGSKRRINLYAESFDKLVVEE